VIRATEEYGRLMRARRTLLILLLPALLLVASATAAPRHATEQPFLIHVDANHPKPRNCGSFEWSTPQADCEGPTAPHGNSSEFYPGIVTVKWCTASTSNCGLGEGYQLPSHNYTRWMKFCKRQGNGQCTGHTNWLLGAVVMPNGPFAVVAGNLGGHAIHPTSHNQTRVSNRGGPLHLVVTYTGSLSNGGGVPSSNGYTFGLIGWLFF
jgi:hypothetical protein